MKRAFWITLTVCIILILTFSFSFYKITKLTGLIISGEKETTITRDLSNFQSLNQEFQINLELFTNGEITAIGIKETFPQDATISNCSEPNYRIIGNTLEILLFDSDKNLTSKSITYNITLPSSGNFAGKWNSTEPDLSEIILGNTGIETNEENSNSNPSESSSGGGGTVKKPDQTQTEFEDNRTANNSEINNENSNNSNTSIEDKIKEIPQSFFKTTGKSIENLFENQKGKSSIIKIFFFLLILLLILHLLRKKIITNFKNIRDFKSK